MYLKRYNLRRKSLFAADISQLLFEYRVMLSIYNYIYIHIDVYVYILKTRTMHATVTPGSMIVKHSALF